jgi:predicted lipoprotein with Yx(FWY)xxD motif
MKRSIMALAALGVAAADEEAESSVVCTGACASFWVPLTIDGGAPSGKPLPSELGVVERGDGTRHVTFDGKRLHAFVEDEPGGVTGDGFSDVGDRRFTRVAAAPALRWGLHREAPSQPPTVWP